MRLTLLGTGCPVASVTRYGPSQIVCDGETTILVDCGSGVTQRLLSAGSAGRAVDAVLLTHLHSDHIVDLFQLIVSSWHQGRDRPQRIFGPRGTRAYVDRMLSLWRPELEQRIAHECRPSTAALEVEATELEDGERLVVGGLAVTVVEVDHKPVRQAFGFVFESASSPQERIVLSGDTRRCEALIEAARGADLLVHEVFVHREMTVTPGVRNERTVANVASYHTSSAQVGKIAAQAGVKCLALTHFVPPACDRAALLQEVTADFAGPVIIGEDLMSIDAVTGVVRTPDGSMLRLASKA